MSDVQDSQEQATGVLKRITRRAGRVRLWVHRRPGGVQLWQVGIGVLGLVVIAVGIAFLALPGPGWATIFVGLGIWATEFAWARSLLRRVRRAAVQSAAWIQRQPRRHKIVAGATGAIVVAAVALGIYLVAT